MSTKINDFLTKGKGRFLKKQNELQDLDDKLTYFVKRKVIFY